MCARRVWLFATPQIVACQAPLSIGFLRQEHWSRLPFPTPRDLSDPGIKPTSLASPAVAGRFLITAPSGKPPYIFYHNLKNVLLRTWVLEVWQLSNLFWVFFFLLVLALYLALLFIFAVPQLLHLYNGVKRVCALHVMRIMWREAGQISSKRSWARAP